MFAIVYSSFQTLHRIRLLTCSLCYVLFFILRFVLVSRLASPHRFCNRHIIQCQSCLSNFNCSFDSLFFKCTCILNNKIWCYMKHWTPNICDTVYRTRTNFRRCYIPPSYLYPLSSLK